MKARLSRRKRQIRFGRKPRPQIIDPDRCGGENRQNHDLRYRFGYLKGKKPKSLTVVFSVMKRIGIVEEVGEAVKTSKSAIKSLFHASANAVLATTAKSNFIRIAATAAGFWAT